MQKTNQRDWLGLAIGNTRLHWAWFRGQNLLETHRSAHLSGDRPPFLVPSPWPQTLPLFVASVVPHQTALVKQCGFFTSIAEITLADIPLKGIYATMGIDRALSVWGAAQTYGVPVLVIDAGTALTFTAVNSQQSTVNSHQSSVNRDIDSPRLPLFPSPPLPVFPSPHLLGGAILPGLRLQFRMLGQQTAALPEVQLPEALPLRWGLDTENAIAAGVLYTVLAGIRDYIGDWRSKFPQGAIILTGGDAEWLQKQLQDIPGILVEPHLVFWGMRSLGLGIESQ